MNISRLYQRRQCPWRQVVLTLLGLALLAVSTTPFVAQADCVPKPDGLVAWWPGDGTAMDVVGTNHGTLQGGVTNAMGEVGQAFSFDGVNSYVQLPQNLFPYPTSGTGNAPFSFELWFATSAGGVILGQQNTAPFATPTGAIPGVYIGTDGKLYSQMFWKGSVDPTISATPVNDGGFHHVAVTYDGANEVVFLDGVAIGGSSFAQQVYAGSYQYQIGTGYSANWPAGNGGWYSFNGLLDEVSLYNRALSSDEIASIYAAGSAGKCFTNDPAPVFVIQPVSQTVYTPNSASFTGVAMGVPRPNYQWYFNGVPVAGATGASLTFTNLSATNAGDYILVATNTSGAATSQVATLTVTVPPFLTGIGSFETGYEGWTVEGGVWEVGVPTSGPGGAHSGTNCAATVLGDNYPNYANASLISPAFVVPPANQNPQLRFWQWFSTEAGWDYGQVYIKTDTGEWTPLSPGYTGSSGVWTRPSLDLSAYAGQYVQVKFFFHSDYSINAPGWYVDEVTLVTRPIQTLVPNVPESFENGFGDWSVDGGVWAVGVPTSGPGVAHSGTNCAATMLGDNYPNNANASLISPAFVVPSAEHNPRLQFWQWFSTEAGWDYGQVYIKVGTDGWAPLSPSYTGNSGVWTCPSLDLSAYAGQSVQVEFYFHSDRTINAPGWYVDEVTLVTEPIQTLLPNVPESFENGFGDWSVEGGAWEVGVPTSGPGSAHSGTNCAATVLAGDYPNNANASLISPAFVVPAAGQNPRLQFWQWFSTEAGWDYGQVYIKAGTNGWTPLSPSYTGGSGVWTRPSLNLSAFVGQSVQVEFYFHSDRSITAAGWYVDEVTLVDDFTLLIDAGVVRTQEVSCLPLTISPGKPAINVSFTLQALSGDLTSVTLDTGNRFTSATVTPLSNFEWLIALQTSPTNPLLGGETVGSVCFNAVSEHSTFGRLVVKDVAATNLDGSLPTTVGSGSGVVIIANEPLLKISLGSSGEWQLALYGKASVQYEIQYTTDLDLPWLTGWTNTMPASMSCSQAVPPTYPQTPALFFRARECVAP